ncbi:hypothetical protein BDR26DRAFT_865639 [Obelidium mucronatum]|nr:hypothetical protein BDR26DRAFT_865639 [Obelidium mucronatum]
MNRWITEEARWTVVDIPFESNQGFRYYPLTRSLVFVHGIGSDFLRLPTKDSFAVIKATFNDGDEGQTLNLSLPLRDTDRIQLIHFDKDSRTLQILLDDFDSEGRAKVKKFNLVVPEADSYAGIHFEFIPEEPVRRIAYKVSRNPTFIKDLYFVWDNSDAKCAAEKLLMAEFETLPPAPVPLAKPSDGSYRRYAKNAQGFIAEQIIPRNWTDGTSDSMHQMIQRRNHSIQAFDGNYVLLPNGRNEDFMMDVMHLHNWRTREYLKTIPLPETHTFLYNGWGELMPGAPYIFVGLTNDVICFYGVGHLQEESIE